jgi:hypothetical protein
MYVKEYISLKPMGSKFFLLKKLNELNVSVKKFEIWVRILKSLPLKVQFY